MNRYKAVIFDLDGTLLNTLQDIYEAINYACKKNGLSETTIDAVRYATGNGKLVLIDKTLKTHPDKPVVTQELYDNVLKDYLYVYSLWKSNHTKPYEGVVRTLNILKKRGIIICVLSNKPHNDTTEIINKYFPKTFDIVQGQIEGVKPKPNKEMTDLVINKLHDDYGINHEEVMYVGDSDVDVDTYKNAGLFGVGACYGFRSKKELEEAGCFETINSMRELLKYFDEPNDGILLVNKPYGMTSQDVVRIVRNKYHVDRVGHAGTLDPLATGLLVLLLGDATKLSNYLLEDKKEYIAEITIGKETNTWDCEGNICLVKEVKEELDIDKTLEKCKGIIKLAPPIYSAIKVDGNKSYDLARAGKEFSLEKRDSFIYDITRVSEVNYIDGCAIFKFKVTVSKGTYIRSLCHYIGELLDYPAYMTDLVRTKSGNLSVENSYSLDDIKEGNAKIINIIDSLPKENLFTVWDSLLPYIDNGRPVILKSDKDMLYMVYNNLLIAIYEKHDDGKYYAKRVWKRS